MAQRQIARRVVVDPGEGREAAPQDARAERRSVRRRLEDAAFADAFERAPEVLLVLALAQMVSAVWLGALQQRGAVLLCAMLALAGLVPCALGHRALRQARAAGAPREQLQRLRRRWQCRMALALLTPALTLAADLLSAGRVELEAVVVLVLVSLYVAAVWAAWPLLGSMAAVGAAACALVCVGLGELRLALSLAAAAMLALWLRHQVAAVWLRAMRARLGADDLSASLARERDAALRAQADAHRFVATASHDLRQPMHALGLFVSSLERRVQGTPEASIVRNMTRSIEALDQSFGAMLDISRLEAGSMEVNLQHFALRDVFRRLHLHFAGLAETAGLGLRFSPGGKSVRSDPQLLERVLGNLVQNALRHTREGGVVVVARSTRTHTNIEVWDTGSGIAPEELPRIFDEFYQVREGARRRQRGLGLGLAIVRRLVRLMGHTLTVASCPGRGTMFRIGIATGALDEMERATAAADTVPMPLFEARSILVIDDDEAIREGLTAVLSEWGYEVMTAAGIGEALALAGEAGGAIDLILSDLHLADGEDGLDAIDSVRRRCALPVPALVITGDTTADEMRRVEQAGLVLLFKPLQPRRLMAALRQMSAQT